jgi:hypothetical protein
MKSLYGLLLSTLLAWCFRPQASGATQADTGDIIINEILIHPPHGHEELQYIELFNRGQSEVDLSGWSFTQGIEFSFPSGTRMAAGSYLVLCRNKAAFARVYGEGVPIAGDFKGRFRRHGERVEVADARKAMVDWVSYSDREPWLSSPKGSAASLERICPKASGRGWQNWMPSAPDKTTPGTPGKKNGCYAASLPPVISDVSFHPPPPDHQAAVTVSVAGDERVKQVSLCFRTFSEGKQSEETELPMSLISGDDRRGVFEAFIPGQPEGALVRFRIKAMDSAGAERVEPAVGSGRPAHSYFSISPSRSGSIARGFLVQVDRPKNEASPGGRRRSARGSGAFIHVAPGGGAVEVFDPIFTGRGSRKKSFKLRFQEDLPFQGMTSARVIVEGSARWVLSEALSHQLYRMAGVPAPRTEHIRMCVDGRPLGYRLLVEQPNKCFLAHNKRDASGNLYKVVWYGKDLVGKHKKKTHRAAGHQDLLAVVEGLAQTSGAEQWRFIQDHFHVEEVISYFAVSMCISDWDGFHNNYFAYHDLGVTGKWEMYPWDKDKTWGDYDSASPLRDWYEMPLTMGMEGDRSPPIDPRSRANNRAGFEGGVAWWRRGGYFARPLLANQQFRQQFLARLRLICETIFTEETLADLIERMEQSLEPEVQPRAEALGRDAERDLTAFKDDIQSLRRQVTHRREFILSEISRAR